MKAGGVHEDREGDEGGRSLVTKSVGMPHCEHRDWERCSTDEKRTYRSQGGSDRSRLCHKEIVVDEKRK